MAATYPPRMPRNSGESHLLKRPEPGKLPAALLALIVHAGFFAVIVFGVTWQVRHPEPVMAELWDKLPSISREPDVPAPPPPPEPEPEVKKIVEPPVEKPLPPQPSKADIQLKAKKEKAEREKIERERLEKQKQVELEKKRKEEEAQKKAAKVAEDKARTEQAARDAAASAARNVALQDYAAKIATLIRTRANIPDTVSGRPALTVRLRLLVNGVVFDAQVIKPSGNRVYDDAVERAINGIRQWPLPENAELFGGRRELNLNIEHER
jgi:colicin import membrane protein